MQCQAHIIREYKTTKAGSVRPSYYAIDKYPEVCNGTLTAAIKMEAEPYYGGTDWSLELEVTCSRCKNGWWPGMEAMRRAVRSNYTDQSFDITPLIEQYPE